LADSPDDVCVDPLRVFETGRHLPLSVRMANAIHRQGWELRSSNAGHKRVDGIRRRMEIEDLIDTTLVAVGRRGVSGIVVNDQARDAFVRHLYDSFHRNRVVLVRRRSGRY
jgi:hypothetical protein